MKRKRGKQDEEEEFEKTTKRRKQDESKKAVKKRKTGLSPHTHITRTHDDAMGLRHEQELRRGKQNRGKKTTRK